MKFQDIPLAARKVLSVKGRKLWRQEIADLVDEPLLVHYAFALNALADYQFIKAKLDEDEKAGKETYVSDNNNGTLGVHPLRLHLEKLRKAFSDETKRCGLTIDMIETLEEKQDDEDPYAEED